MRAGVRVRRSAFTLAALLLVAACASANKTGGASSTSASGGTGSSSTPVASGALGQGVTADAIKLGVVAPDFKCFQQFVDQIRVDEEKVWGAYVDAINTAGGINGRKVVMDFKKFCPVPGTGLQPAVLCTRFTEDDKVFALLGTFVDFSGDAQLCVAKGHKTPLISYLLNREWIDKAPPGLLLSPQIAKERRVEVLLTLLGREKTLAGKKLAILGETVTQSAVNSTITPGLKRLGVDTGSTAILQINGSDTTTAQSQLDSFIEKWKSEGVDALFISGEQVSSKQFVQKIRKDMPDVLLIADNSGVVGYGQDFVLAKTKPNPYEGIITADGDTGAQHQLLPQYAKCAKIYTDAFGGKAPTFDEVLPGPNGKTIDRYGLMEDACTLTQMFAQIATKAGPTLNNATWTNAVDNFGPIEIEDTRYASIRKGKYDADDTFRLVAFDSSIGPKGDWKELTPVQNVAESSSG